MNGDSSAGSDLGREVFSTDALAGGCADGQYPSPSPLWRLYETEDVLISIVLRLLSMLQAGREPRDFCATSMAR